MAWRWYKRLRLFGGLNANLSNNGVGWSWGVGFVRFGVSSNGRQWISFGVPGTGFRYLKYLENNYQQQNQPQIEEEIIADDEPENQPKPIRKWKNLK
jgi:hypothetical protein